MSITSNLPLRMCALAALVALATGTPAGTVSDCVDNERRTVADGGTNGVNSVYAAHIDDDSHVDVLSASANDDKIAWYESDGNTPPSFNEHVISTNADGASSVVAADLDDDGDTDVVSASANDNKISWYESDGGSSPRFIERVILTGAQNAAQVYVEDYDGDGDLDVLVASIDDDTIEICESDLAQKDPGDTSPPAFSEVIVSTGANGAASVFAIEMFDDPDEDLDDGIKEVLSASRLDGKVAWYQFVFVRDPDTDEVLASDWIEHALPGGADGATSVFGIDVDGDTDIDVIAASNGDNKIAWWENQGGDPAVFVKHVISDQAQGASSVFAIDIDGDTDVDVVSASRFDHKVAWYENLGGGNFGNSSTNQQLIASAPGAASVFAIDFDQDLDGDIDVLAASSVAGPVASNDKIAWHENLGAGAFTERGVSGGAVAPEALLAVDVDLVGGIDVIAASSVDDTIVWYANDGATAPDEPLFTRNVLSSNAPQAQDLFWADIDGDGNEDVVAALAGDDSIAWYKSGEFGDTPSNRRDISTGQADGASSVFAIDLDGDGDTDVAATSSNDDSLRWFESDLAATATPPPNFTGHVVTNTIDGPLSVFAIDIDQDDDIDLVTASSEDDSIRWFESDGMAPPAFTEHLITSTINGPRDVLAVDMDQDGDIDVAVVSANDDRISWYEQFIDPNDVVQVTVGSPDSARLTVTPLAGDLFTLAAPLADTLTAPNNVPPQAADSFAGQADVVTGPDSATQPTTPLTGDSFTTGGGGDTVTVDQPDVPSADVQQRTTRKLLQVLDLTVDANDAVLTDLTVTRLGTAIDADTTTGGIRLWHDVNSSNTWDAGDAQLGSSQTFSAGSVTFSGMSFTITSGTPEKLLVTADIAAAGSSIEDNVIGSSINAAGDVVLSGGDTVSISAPLNGNLHTITDSGDMLFVGQTSTGGGTLSKGTTNNVVMVLDLTADNDSVSLTDLTVTRTGDGADGDTEASGVKLWHDVNNDNTWDGGDQQLSTSETFDAGSVTFVNIDFLTTAGTPEKLLITYDITAVAGDNVIGAQIDMAGQIQFTPHFLPTAFDFVRALESADMDGDGDVDLVTASSGDDTVAWHQSNRDVLTSGVTPTLVPRDVTTNAESARAIAVADLDGDGKLDIVTGFFFEIGWHRGDATETCDVFDVTGDGIIDGQELALLGGGFGQAVAFPCVASDAWWLDPSVDYNGDCQIDGDDLAILTSREVWGNSTATCTDPECPDVCAFTCP